MDGCRSRPALSAPSPLDVLDAARGRPTVDTHPPAHPNHANDAAWAVTRTREDHDRGDEHTPTAAEIPPPRTGTAASPNSARTMTTLDDLMDGGVPDTPKHRARLILTAMAVATIAITAAATTALATSGLPGLFAGHRTSHSTTPAPHRMPASAPGTAPISSR